MCVCVGGGGGGGGVQITIFGFLHKNIFCGYSLEVPLFSWRNKKNMNTLLL